MRFFLDCEFQEDGKTIDLISIGVASEGGGWYYAESNEYDQSKATPWLRKHVLPLLTTAKQLEGGSPNRTYLKSRSDIAVDLITFLGAAPEIWGWYGSYDWVVLCQLYGTMMELPATWPMYIRETRQLMDESLMEVLAATVPRVTPEHNALYDAEWQRDVFFSINREKKHVV